MSLNRLYCPFEVKMTEGSEPGSFEGYGAVFNNVDSKRDKILPGAFRDEAQRALQTGQYPSMYLEHGLHDPLPVGIWTGMSEDSNGLYMKGQVLGLGTDHGKRVHELVQKKALTGLSIGFRPQEFEWGTEPNGPRRILKKVSLPEVSLTSSPANTLARVTSVKSLLEDLEGKRGDARFLEEVLVETGYSPLEAKAMAAAAIRAVPQHEAGADLTEVLRSLRGANAGLK